MIKFFLFLFKNKRFFITKIYAFYNESKQKENFVHRFGYWPEGLEYSNFEYLDLSENSRIGNYNKLILSETKFPSSNKKSLISLAPNTWTGTGVELNIISGSQIIIKQYSTIQDYCKLIGDVTVENYSMIAPATFISSGKHYAEFRNSDIIRNQDQLNLNDPNAIKKHSKPVHIEEDCWIGYNCFIGAGIYIGRGSQIGANTVVNKDVLPYSNVSGVTGKQYVNYRFEFEPPYKIDAENNEHLPYFYRGFLQKNEERVDFADNSAMGIGGNSCILVLKKEKFASIKVTGVLKRNTINTDIQFHLIFNGHSKLIKQIDIQGNECFEFAINEDEFKSLDDKINDSVYRLSKHFNIFQLSYTVTNDLIVGIKTFEEISAEKTHKKISP